MGHAPRTLIAIWGMNACWRVYVAVMGAWNAAIRTVTRTMTAIPGNAAGNVSAALMANATWGAARCAASTGSVHQGAVYLMVE